MSAEELRTLLVDSDLDAGEALANGDPRQADLIASVRSLYLDALAAKDPGLFADYVHAGADSSRPEVPPELARWFGLGPGETPADAT